MYGVCREMWLFLIYCSCIGLISSEADSRARFINVDWPQSNDRLLEVAAGRHVLVYSVLVTQIGQNEK